MTKDPTEADIEALVAIFDASDWEELHISSPDFELFLSKRPGATPGQTVTHLSPAAAPQSAPARPAAPLVTMDGNGRSVAPATEAVCPQGWTAISAPNLGTFYRSPKPEEPAFVEIGQRIGPEDQVCLLEVMKLFTSVVAGISGVVREICVKNGAMVEQGQVLFWIEADA